MLLRQAPNASGKATDVGLGIQKCGRPLLTLVHTLTGEVWTQLLDAQAGDAVWLPVRVLVSKVSGCVHHHRPGGGVHLGGGRGRRRGKAREKC